MLTSAVCNTVEVNFETTGTWLLAGHKYHLHSLCFKNLMSPFSYSNQHFVLSVKTNRIACGKMEIKVWVLPSINILTYQCWQVHSDQDNVLLCFTRQASRLFWRRYTFTTRFPAVYFINVYPTWLQPPPQSLLRIPMSPANSHERERFQKWNL